MRKIVILCGHYLPGYKAGGPVRTLINICENLGEEYDITIITGDRDKGETVPYANINYDKPNRVGNANVWYLPQNGFTFKNIKRLTKDADLIYCCGPYDNYAYKAMILKRLGKIKQPLVIASMGTFSKGALSIKSTKKKVFFSVCKFLGLFKKVVWSVTSKFEEQDVKRTLGNKAKCIIAEDLPRKVKEIKKKTIIREPLRIVFLSRICEMKNLLFAVQILNEVNCKCIFDIYGAMEDISYWGKCKQQNEMLPPNIKWEYKGEACSETVIEIFSQYDIFLLPSKGENYGHVVYEALAGGCVPIISDRTPWQNLNNKNCGWVLSLDNKEEFVKAIEDFCQMTYEQRQVMVNNAVAYAKNKYKESIKNTGYRKIFEL